MTSGPVTLRHINGETKETVTDFIFLVLKSCWQWLQLWHQKMLAPWKKSYNKARQHIKKQRHYFANKSLCSQSYYFSSSHVRMWELDHKEGWMLKNWYFQIVGLEKTLESPREDCKEIKPVNPKENQPWIFVGKIDAQAEALILWLPDGKSWFIQKDPDAAKDWRQEKKGTDDWMASLIQWAWVWPSSRS